MKAQILKSFCVLAMTLMIYSSLKAQTFVSMRVTLVGSQTGVFPLESSISSITGTYSNQIQTLTAGPDIPNTSGFGYIESTGLLTFNLANFGSALIFAPAAFATTFEFEVEINSQTFSTGAFTIPTSTVNGQPAPVDLGTLNTSTPLDPSIFPCFSPTQPFCGAGGGCPCSPFHCIPFNPPSVSSLGTSYVYNGPYGGTGLIFNGNNGSSTLGGYYHDFGSILGNETLDLVKLDGTHNALQLSGSYNFKLNFGTFNQSKKSEPQISCTPLPFNFLTFYLNFPAV